MRSLFLGASLVVGVTLMAQLLYFKEAFNPTPATLLQKERLSALIGLPDLALVSEAHYVRHRSLSDTFSYFNESPELLEYFPSTFVYAHNTLSNPSRITYEP